MSQEFDIHFHVGGLAMMDIFVTAFVAYLIAYRMKWSIPLTILGAFVLGIVVHRILDVRTAVDRFLFNT